MTTPASKSDLGVPYRLSNTYVRFLWGLHIGAMALVCFAAFVVWAKILICFVLAFNLTRVQRRLKQLERFTALHYSGEQWWVNLGVKQLPAVQTRAPLLLHWLVVLYLKVEGKVWSVPVLSDSTDPDSFRRLRILLNR